MAFEKDQSKADGSICDQLHGHQVAGLAVSDPKKMKMNTLLGAIGGLRRALLVVAVATGTMLCAGIAHAGCSDETLKGTYGLRVSGEVRANVPSDDQKKGVKRSGEPGRA